MLRVGILILALSMGLLPLFGQNILVTSPPGVIVANVRLDGPVRRVWIIGIAGGPLTGGTANVKFKFDRVEPRRDNSPNFIVLSALPGKLSPDLDRSLSLRPWPATAGVAKSNRRKPETFAKLTTNKPEDLVSSGFFGIRTVGRS